MEGDEGLLLITICLNQCCFSPSGLQSMIVTAMAVGSVRHKFSFVGPDCFYWPLLHCNPLALTDCNRESWWRNRVVQSHVYELWHVLIAMCSWKMQMCCSLKPEATRFCDIWPVMCKSLLVKTTRHVPTEIQVLQVHACCQVLGG